MILASVSSSQGLPDPLLYFSHHYQHLIQLRLSLPHPHWCCILFLGNVPTLFHEYIASHWSSLPIYWSHLTFFLAHTHLPSTATLHHCSCHLHWRSASPASPLASAMFEQPPSLLYSFPSSEPSLTASQAKIILANFLFTLCMLSSPACPPTTSILLPHPCRSATPLTASMISRSLSTPCDSYSPAPLAAMMITLSSGVSGSSLNGNFCRQGVRFFATSLTAHPYFVTSVMMFL